MIDENKIKVKTVERSDDGTYGKFGCEPLDRGYGITLGNSLRRVLLSSLDGVAITSIKIDGVLHEFSTLPGVREDISEIILNLKQLSLKFTRDEVDELDITVDVSGECEFTAKDLDVNSDIEILNPELHIATLDTDAHIQCNVISNGAKDMFRRLRTREIQMSLVSFQSTLFSRRLFGLIMKLAISGSATKWIMIR